MVHTAYCTPIVEEEKGDSKRGKGTAEGYFVKEKEMDDLET